MRESFPLRKKTSRGGNIGEEKKGKRKSERRGKEAGRRSRRDINGKTGKVGGKGG